MLNSWFTIGSEDNTGTGGLSAVGMEPYLDGFNTADGFTVDTFTGASWFIIPGASADAIAGDDNRVLVAQLTTDGIVTVVLNAQYDDATGNTSTAIGLTATFPQLAAGCTDATACNYDGDAEADDGSCVFPGDACDDGDSLTINDDHTMPTVRVPARPSLRAAPMPMRATTRLQRTPTMALAFQ